MNRILLIIFLGFSLTACSSYPNQFKCGDARGLGCTMLRDVDMQIDSGEVETVYANRKKNCKNNGKSCLTEGGAVTGNVLESSVKSRAWWFGDEEDGADDRIDF